MARKKTIAITRKPPTTEAADASIQFAIPEPPLKLNLNFDAPSTELRGPSATDSKTIGYGPIGRVVYGTVYRASYAVVFSAILLGKLIPGSRLIGHALRDGSSAAQHSFTPK